MALSVQMFLWDWAVKRGEGAKQRNRWIRMKRCDSPFKNWKNGTFVKFSGSLRNEGNSGEESTEGMDDISVGFIKEKFDSDAENGQYKLLDDVSSG